MSAARPEIENGGAEEEVVKEDPLPSSTPGGRDGDANDGRSGGEDIEAEETDPMGDEEDGDPEKEAVQGGHERPDRGRKAIEHGDRRADEPGGDRGGGATLRAPFLLLEGDVAGPRVGDAALEEADEAVAEETGRDEDEDEEQVEASRRGRELFGDDRLGKEIAAEKDEDEAHGDLD